VSPRLVTIKPGKIAAAKLKMKIPSMLLAVSQPQVAEMVATTLSVSPAMTLSSRLKKTKNAAKLKIRRKTSTEKFGKRTGQPERVV
jgi:hypothetical protein